MLALGATVPGLPVLVHDGLKDGGEGRHTNTCGDEHRVLGPEDVARGGSVGTVDVYLNVCQEESLIYH